MTTVQETVPARIVVGIDGSEESKQALRWARDLALAIDARVEAVAVWQYPPTYGWTYLPTEWNPADDMDKVLTTCVDEVFGPHRPARVELIVREGQPSSVLVEASKGATMLVVGSRGHGGFAGLLLGSVSSAVAEHATCPVLVVHGDQAFPGPRR
jgi:nucleotide-binding universal stress UspA family protein